MKKNHFCFSLFFCLIVLLFAGCSNQITKDCGEILISVPFGPAARAEGDPQRTLYYTFFITCADSTEKFIDNLKSGDNLTIPNVPLGECTIEAYAYPYEDRVMKPIYRGVQSLVVNEGVNTCTIKMKLVNEIQFSMNEDFELVFRTNCLRLSSLINPANPANPALSEYYLFQLFYYHDQYNEDSEEIDFTGATYEWFLNSEPLSELDNKDVILTNAGYSVGGNTISIGLFTKSTEQYKSSELNEIACLITTKDGKRYYLSTTFLIMEA